MWPFLPECRGGLVSVSASPPAKPLSGVLIIAMAATTGLAVANIYYNQPMLGLIERELAGATVLVPTFTQLGFALGLFLLVPMGDWVERRGLIVYQFLALAIALALAALARTSTELLLASMVVGALSSVAQQIVPFAAHMAQPERRGAVIGAVMAGLLCGILLSRVLAGFVAEKAGWRSMLLLGAPLALASGALLRWLLPVSRPETETSYLQLLGSLWRLWWELSPLRRATLTQGFLFAAFGAFWSILSLRLQQLGEGATVAGLFGLVGVVGVLAAPLAGRLADRRGPRTAISAGIGLALVAWGIADRWQTVAGLAVAGIVLDLAVQSAMISHQQIVYALKPDARARLNTLFVGGMFLCGTLGSAFAAMGWQAAGWRGVSLLGFAFAGLAGLAAIEVRRKRR